MQGALVVNADDLGVSRGATLGIVRAYRDGIVTSASLAATTPFYGHAQEACVTRCPELGIGLHFTLTSGRPVSPARDVPLLVDGDGVLRGRFVRLLTGLGGRRRAALLAQIELELEAQLQRILRDGVRPDHIDGERHVHLIPGIFEAVVAAAARHQVPFVRCGRDLGRGLLRAGHVPALLASGGFAKSLLLGTLARRGRGRLGPVVRTASGFASYLYSGRPGWFLKGLLDGSPRPGVTEVMVHPGVPEESAGVSLGNRELERYLTSGDRRLELQACIDARSWTSGWTPTTFGKLAARGVSP